MDDVTFDDLSRRLGRDSLARRTALARLFGAALGIAAGQLTLADTDAAKKRRKKKKMKPPSGCTPNCTRKECGDDGCGGSCGRCPEGAVCTGDGECQTDCLSDCDSKDCGDDGCGGSCGTCDNGFTCAGGVCECPAGACGGVCCGNGQTCVAGSCCANSRVCNGACCASSQTCIGNTCCGAGRVCGNVCCAGSETCLDNGCCPNARICNGVCCPADQPCRGNICCPSSRVCGQTCCAANQTCLGSQCCATGRICGQTCCGANTTCIGSQCCPDARACGATCCPGDGTCVNGACRSSAALDTEESAFLTLINNHRAGSGRNPLAAQSQLTAAAERHSQDMAANGFFSHTGSDGTDAGRRITAAGYRWSAWGENIFWHSSDGSAATAFAAWKNSSSHNSNMLDPDFTEIGIARVRAGNGRWYWTTTFGDR